MNRLKKLVLFIPPIIFAIIIIGGCSSTGSSPSIAGMSDHEVCGKAAKSSGNFIYWSDTGVNEGYLKETLRRGLTLEQCIALIGRTPQGPPPPTFDASMSNKKICTFAITVSEGKFTWFSKYSYANLYSKEAQRRGYTPEQCAALVGRTITKAAKKQKTEIAALVAEKKRLK